MSSPRFFIQQKLALGAHFLLPPGPARHAARVLRLSVGDALQLFNGEGGAYAARIEQIRKDEVEVRVTAFENTDCESPLQVLLAQGISSGERMDYTLQKAVELGVSAIQPIAAKRSRCHWRIGSRSGPAVVCYFYLRRPARSWPICLNRKACRFWSPDPKAVSKPTKSPHSNPPMQLQCGWGRAYCAPRPLRWRRWRRCRRYGAIFSG